MIRTAADIIECCRYLATFTEEPGRTTRTFLSPPMRQVHEFLSEDMRAAGLDVFIDNVGNIFGRSPKNTRPRILIGSHLDTVPDAGAFDGILGVVMGIALAHRHPIDVIGFSEEEGVRFGIPFIGSRAYIGTLDLTSEISQAIRDYGLNPSSLPKYEPHDVYLEFHIEQGPLLESLNLPLAVVTAIISQRRVQLVFQGKANHAGTTPMSLRADALAAAAEWICIVERTAKECKGLVATVGRVQVEPNAGNVIPGKVALSLDVRHASDSIGEEATAKLLQCARQIAERRGVQTQIESLFSQPTVSMDEKLVATLTEVVGHQMTSGAGHDAMIVAERVPSAMMFLRSPGGISHHSDESVFVEDVAAALEVGSRAIQLLRESYA